MVTTLGMMRSSLRRSRSMIQFLREFGQKNDEWANKAADQTGKSLKLAKDEFFHEHETLTAQFPETGQTIHHNRHVSSSIHGDTFRWHTEDTTTVRDHGVKITKSNVVSVEKAIESAGSQALSRLFTPKQLKFYRSLQDECDKVPVLKMSPEDIQTAVEKAYGRGADKKQKVFHLVVGPPGSGKSSVVVDDLQQRYGSMIVDSDHIKPHLPGYNRGVGGNAVHGASAQIASRVLVRALENGDNVIHPTTGYCPEYILELLSAAKSRGYKVGLHLVDLPKEEAAKRVFRRAELERNGSRQIVNLSYTLDVVGDKPKAAYEQVLAQGRHLLDEYSHWNNHVPQGSPPELVHKSRQSISDLLKKEAKKTKAEKTKKE